jgi:hypothetical protein
MKRLAWAMLGALAIASAHAAPGGSALVQQDLLTAGDGLVTLDQNTGLQWLDTSATRGISVQDIQNGAGGWLGRGFHYATFDDIKTLYTDAGLAEPGSCSYQNPTSDCYMSGSYDDGVRFFDLLYGSQAAPMGGFEAPTPCTWHSGVCADHLENGQWVPTTSYTYLMALNLNPALGVVTFDPSGASPTFTVGPNESMGNWLVRDALPPIPEPSSTLMLACGLAAVAGLGRKARAAKNTHAA